MALARSAIRAFAPPFRPLLLQQAAGREPPPSLRRFRSRTPARIVVLAFGARQVVSCLEVQPKSRIDVEIAAKANGRVGRYVPPPANDVADPVSRHADRLGEGARGEPERLQIFLGEDFAGIACAIGA